MTDHERFENWFAIELEKGSLYLADKEDCFWLWQAATKAERERCAKIAEEHGLYHTVAKAIRNGGE
jgi:hypothetical protein